MLRFQKMDVRRILYATTTVLILIMIITTVAKSVASKKITEREGYKVIRDVSGIEFQVNKEFSDYSTAVLEISKNIDFLDYQTYSYKDGNDTYLLFNMNSFIIIAKKGTCFDFQNMDLQESLSRNSLDGIWFTLDGKNPVKESSADKYILSVSAQVVITPLVYNDFKGNLVTIKRDGEEWAFFAGTVSKAPEEYVESMNYTASTIMPVTVDNIESLKYAVVDDVSEEMGYMLEGETVVGGTGESGNDSNQMKEADPVLPTDPVIIETEYIYGESEDNTFHINDKQLHQDLERGKVYESSPYAMLSVGNAGIASVVNDNGGNYSNIYIKIDQLYSNEETRELIAKYIASGESYYSEMTAPEGMHFEAVSYSIKYLDSDPSYVNIKLCGLDGEDLRYRGIIYPHITYDIGSEIELRDGWRSGYVCFYAIPNGCSEYALFCGPGAEKTDQYSSYFYIRSKK